MILYERRDFMFSRLFYPKESDNEEENRAKKDPALKEHSDAFEIKLGGLECSENEIDQILGSFGIYHYDLLRSQDPNEYQHNPYSLKRCF